MRLLAAAAALSTLLTPATAIGQEPAPTGDAALAAVIGDRVAGAPTSCILLSAIRSTEIVDGTAIVFRPAVGDSGRIYINRPRSGARNLSDDDILVTRSNSTSLCRTHNVDLIDRNSRASDGFVLLGDFVPYDLPPVLQ